MRKKLLALLTMICLLTCTLPVGLSAYAESITVYIVSNTMKAYKSPSTSSTVLGVMSYGERLSCTGVKGEWARIRNSAGATAYCKKSCLSRSNPNKYSAAAYITANNVKVYKKPSISSKVMMKLKVNSSYTCVAVTRDGKWCRLKNGRYYGYVQSEYVSKAPVEGKAETGKVYVSSNTLKVYKSASSSSRCLGTMSFGESMTCLATSGNWARVKNSVGAIGYCAKSGISSENPCTLSETVYISVSNAKVYRKPSSSSDVMMRLKLNSSYMAVGITGDGKWLRLKNGKYYGYVQTSCVADRQSASVPRASKSVYVITQYVNVYKEPSSSSTLMGVVPFGESLGFFSVEDRWAKVQNSHGAIGYCLCENLSNENPCRFSNTMYIVRDNVKIYAKPMTSSTVTATLKTGNSVTVVGFTPDALWARIRDGMGYGYVQMQDVSENKVDNEKNVFISANTLNVYEKPSSSAKLLGVMSFGESLTLLSINDGWACVRNVSGKTGYCIYGGLTAIDPCSMSSVQYIQKDNTVMYAKPLTSADRLRTLRLNDSVKVIGITPDDEWMRIVDSELSFGYIQKQFLSTVSVPDDEAAIHPIEEKTVYVRSTTLPVYKKNDVSSSVLGTMSFGESMTCIGASKEWAQVKNASGAIGYCKISGLSDTNPNKYNLTLYAQTDGVKVYTKPLTSSGVLGSMNRNAMTTGVAISTDEKWVRAKNGSTYGYIQASMLATSPASGSSAKASSVISLANKLYGSPYVYGASGSSKFDCSGFTYYVFKTAAGISLKRTAYQQGYDSRYPTIHSISDLKVGDLVLFNTDGEPDKGGDDDACDHVGIYIGGKTFIHASSVAGKVITSSLDSSSYYYRNFSWGKRVLK